MITAGKTLCGVFEGATIGIRNWKNYTRDRRAEEWTSLDTRIQRGLHYLAAHPNAPFDLDKLAGYCGLSPSRFSHLFRAELGTTPQKYSEKQRLDFALQLLTQTNLSVREVAAEVGFEDALYFSRRFRLTFGKPPSAASSAR